MVSQKLITAPAISRRNESRLALFDRFFDSEMRLWAVLRAGRVVQSRSFLKQ